MTEYGKKSPNASVDHLGIRNVDSIWWNASPAELTEETLILGQGFLTENGTLAVETGEFTGRSPKDRFIVCDEVTENAVWWGDINIKFDAAKFDQLQQKMTAYLQGKDIYVRDSYVCADPEYRMNVRVVTEYPWSSMFAYNLFLRPTDEEIQTFEAEWHIINAPGFYANPAVDGTRQHNFAILNFSKKIVLIGGTGYTGEIKKSIFSALNFILPHQKNVLSMHCSANIGVKGDTAVFFGLSGTGKTTLSSDPDRTLIGDDEHGWSDRGVFNFEGGCYAKCIDLSAEKEPQIYNAIKFGALLENIGLHPGTRQVNYADKSITENTRVSYPIDFIDNIVTPSVGPVPHNIFYLTADAYGVLPPISRLTPGQAMYHFISGYTAKVAGTEAGVIEPQATFSACFGSAFMPLHPTKYAELLGKKMKENDVRIWLINTGWSGGAYGVGSRMSLKYTRAMITAALNGELDNVGYTQHEIFGLSMPNSCPDVPFELLNPRGTWADPAAYDAAALKLAGLFKKNFEKYADYANDEILEGAPKAAVNA
ncbi:MAG: phosphoenolpyruvate carboxykinase (ATP) [Flavobacteriales bacterium]